jgi:hypothetical protein
LTFGFGQKFDNNCENQPQDSIDNKSQNQQQYSIDEIAKTVDEWGAFPRVKCPMKKTLASLFKMLMQLFLHCDTWRVPTGYNGLKTGGAYT